MEELEQEDSAVFNALFNRSRVNAVLQLDSNGVIKKVNPAFTSFFGYGDSDLKGKHFSILFTDEDKRNRKPWIEIETVLAKGQADDKNFMVHKNGQVSWVSGESILIEQESGTPTVLKVLQDIHQQKDAENSLHQITDFNDSILQVIDDFVVLLDGSLRIVKFNPSFTRLFLADEKTAALADFAAIISPFDVKENLLQQVKQVAASGIPFSKTLVEFNTHSGDRVFEISCQPIFTRDLSSVLLLVGHDITIHKRTETEREDLMGFVVHELRSPLTSIRMSNDIMSMMLPDDSSEMASLLEKNKKYIERLTGMIAELYDAAKLGGGTFQLNMAAFDFNEMMEESLATFRTLHPDFNITTTGTVVQKVMGDRYRLSQVMSNYLANAVKYSGEQRNINIDTSITSTELQVAVEDKGVGVTASQMPYLFDRFFRAEKTRSLEGIGLGLFLCRRIIQAHGGEVWATSKDGQGSVFYFTLPMTANPNFGA
ncbi:MAG: PAS domain-containing sensor histidine kinase [Chitinophagaceae bacterium]